MFIYYLVYLVFMIVIYALVPLLGGDIPLYSGIVKFYAALNVVFLFTVIWWNARKHFYYVWGLYLIVMAGYYGFVYPTVQDFPLVVVFGVSALNILITFYDVVICRCKGIYQRTQKRYAIH
ncbi:hypothetical protein [Xenorhabdus sp. KJ12.1]|uniref:hypothetical protein n=1 Tax=Xenorhabdus sp. KJ12.1 TaxID=1851571 RepID=UPI000C040274|nr:hypothetical protein [Xenorhabdus sp. KJ12.1]PHM72407.1 hypothetical protein Xekj_00686 [Xenorhabdus sp. KJ12.1]